MAIIKNKITAVQFFRNFVIKIVVLSKVSIRILLKVNTDYDSADYMEGPMVLWKLNNP